MAGPSPVLAALPPTTMATPSPSGLPMGANAAHATEQAGQWMQRFGSISTMPGPLGLIAPVGQTEITSGSSQPLSLSALMGGRSRWTATMPGLVEELVFRGVFHSFSNRAFPRSWKIAGAACGWGLIITAEIHLFGQA